MQGGIVLLANNLFPKKVDQKREKKGFRWPILLIWVGVIIVLTTSVIATHVYRRETTLYDSVNNQMLVSRDASVPAWAFATGLFGRGLHLNFTGVTSWPANQTPQNFENRNTIAVFNKTFGNRTYEFWFRINKTGQIDNDGLLFIGATSTGGAGILIDTQGSGKLRISSSYAHNDSLSATAYQAKRIDVGDTFWTSRGLIAYWPFNGTGNATHFKEFANGGASYWAKRGVNVSWYVNTTYGYYPWDNSTTIGRIKYRQKINVTQYNLLNRTTGSIYALVKAYNNSASRLAFTYIIHSGEQGSADCGTTAMNNTCLRMTSANSAGLIGFDIIRTGNTTGATTICTVQSARRFNQGQWYSVIATWNTSESSAKGFCQIWVNGSLEGTDTQAYIQPSLLSGQYTPWAIVGGATNSNHGADGRSFNGSIDELAIFAQQLNQSDIQKIAWSNFSDNQWHHVAFEHGVYGSKGNIGFFVDGRKYGQFNNTNTTHSNPVTGNYVFQVGCSELSCTTPAKNTIIDNLRVSNITRFGMFNGSFIPKKYMTSDRNTLAFWTFDYPINRTSLRFCNSLQYHEAVALNATFHDEVNSTKINITSAVGNFRLHGQINKSQIGNINLSRNNINHLSLCITPATENFKTNASIRISKSGWNYRHIYYDYRINNLSNVTIFPKWYLLQSSVATLITLKITDSLDTPLSDIITEIQKFYIANNTWITIGMTKSGEDGQDTIYLQQNEIDYRFILFQKGKQVKLTTGQKLTAATYTIKIVPTTLSNLITDVKDIQTNMTYNNHTKYFSYGFFDPNSKMAGACLQASVSNTSGRFFKPVNCSYGSFRGILRSSPGNYSQQTAFGYGYVILNGSTLNFGKQTLEVTQGITRHLSTWGKYGIYLMLILTVGIVMIFIGSPVGMIVALMVTLFISWWMDIFTLSTIFMTGIMIGLGVLIKELRS